MHHKEFIHQFSKLGKISKFGVLLTSVFLLIYVVLNILVYSENDKRLSLIDSINRDSASAQISEIQINLSNMDRIVDQAASLSPEEQEKIKAHLTFLTEKIDTLQSGPLATLAATSMANQFVKIRAALQDMQRIVGDATALALPEAKDKMNDALGEVTKAFLQIELQTQHEFQDRVSSTLEALREEERVLFVFGLAFVVLGVGMIVFLVLDLFRRGEMLEKAQEAERMKSSFFAMMSHEIRTPINGILGTLRLLQDTSLDNAQKQLTHTAFQSAEGLLVIINDVLDYSKIEAGKLELELSDFRLRSMLQGAIDLVKPLAQVKGLKLSLVIADDVTDALHGDALRIRQILLNFLSNAVKFTASGFVHLEVKLQQVEHDGLNIRHIRFEVTDSGMGIPPDVKQRLFKEFSQADGSHARRFEGTGLGLAICRRLVEMMRGFVGVISEVGKGSTFWFSFPLRMAQGAILEEETAPASEEKKVATSFGARILVAEDNPTNRMIAEAFLKKGEHTVITAENGLLAVEAVKNNTIDLILMDISMPEMDGFNATKAIRAMGGLYKDMPIIAMTAHAMRGDREACLAAGMNDYITKPINREELLRMVTKWMPKGADRSAAGSIFSQATLDKSAAVSATATQPPETKGDDVPAISESHFKQILSDLGRSNVSHFASLFLQDLKNTGESMLQAYAQKNWTVLKTNAHSLKSSTLSFGLASLSALAQKIEAQCKSQTQPDDALMKAWPEEVTQSVAALNARMAKEGLPPLS